MYASTKGKSIQVKIPLFSNLHCVYQKTSPGWSLNISNGHDTSFLQKRGEIYLRNSVQPRKKAVQAKATRLCTRLQGCFSGGGRWHLLEGNFRTGKGEPGKLGLQAHSLLGETSLSMHPRTKGQPLLLQRALYLNGLQPSKAQTRKRRGIIENPGHSIAQPATHFFAIKFRFSEKATKI